MSRIRTGLIALLIAAVATTSSPALAQRGDDRSFAGFQVSRATAVDIARAQGVREVLKVDARRGVWRVEGLDRDGHRLVVEVDGFTGAVVKTGR